MAREYPRFLYSNPKDTKSEGPFVVHLLFPKIIYRVYFKKNEDEILLSALDPLDFFDSCSDKEAEDVFNAAVVWIRTMIKLGRIEIPPLKKGVGVI